jgi:hypothetical protein
MIKPASSSQQAQHEARSALKKTVWWASGLTSVLEKGAPRCDQACVTNPGAADTMQSLPAADGVVLSPNQVVPCN